MYHTAILVDVNARQSQKLLSQILLHAHTAYDIACEQGWWIKMLSAIYCSCLCWCNHACQPEDQHIDGSRPKYCIEIYTWGLPIYCFDDQPKTEAHVPDIYTRFGQSRDFILFYQQKSMLDKPPVSKASFAIWIHIILFSQATSALTHKAHLSPAIPMPHIS